ncbi:MAG: class B sortase [Lachnospiraceae bacterium]|nr:class B sortase [Lachnospiraceae bacterium]
MMNKKSHLALSFLTAFLLISGFLFLRTLREYNKGVEIYEDLQQEVQLTESSGAFPDISLDVEELLEENDDFCAWIYYEDGKLNHPIVQESYEEINKYLQTAFDGSMNSAGCLFLPFDAAADFTAYNTFIHGHNMRNGSMFGSLKKLYREPEANEYPYFFIWTKDHERIMYHVLAIYVTDENSVKDAICGSANLVTLSTCYGASGSDMRLLIQGIEILRENWD